MNPVVQVVSVRGVKPDSDAARQIVYCGRAAYGWPGHPLANPHKLAPEDADDEHQRRLVLARYRAELLARPTLEPDLARLWADTECGRKALGCWCAPKSCHCDVLAELLTERFGRKEPA